MKNKIKLSKKQIMIIVVALIWISNFAYGYANIVSKQLQENVAVIKTPSINIKMESNELNNNQYIIKALDKKDIIIKLTNDQKKDVYYHLLHEKVNTGIMIYTSSEINGKLNVNESKELIISLDNQTMKDETVTFYLQTSYEEIINKDFGYSYINIEPNFDHSKANKPILDNSMIPITYVKNSAVEGYYIKADHRNINSKAIWYDYDNGIWANVALVNKDKLSYYQKASAGTIIKNEDILAYYVWIPKFRYIINNYHNYNSYEVVNNVIFENESLGTIKCKDVSEDKYFVSESCVDEINGKIYENLSSYSHPAFTDNEGFWVAKFPMSGNERAVPFVNASKETIVDAIKYARSMELEGNVYGIYNTSNELLEDGTIKNDNNNVTTKVLTNEEWGAILILSNSMYGKSGNSNYYDEKSNMYTKIYPNLNSNYTGCTSDYNSNISNFITSPSEKCIAYNDLSNYTHRANGVSYSVGEVGPGASTTGTIYGVYDMAGANLEMVASIQRKQDGTLPIDKYEKYVTTYAYNEFVGYLDSQETIKNLFHYKLGDGIREYYRTLNKNGLWHNGYINQQVSNGVFLRGGDYQSGKGASIYSVDIVDVNQPYTYRTSIIVIK